MRVGSGLRLIRAIALAAAACAELPAWADLDEAWLQRSASPAGTQPLLAIILDHSLATTATLAALPAYDPSRDYGAGIPSAARCDPAKVYFRRGPGPAPDCAAGAGLDSAPRDAESGFHCDAARAALGGIGYYVASRAAQWRKSNEGGYWYAPDAESSQAVECRADRGRHGATPGSWFAGDGTGRQWSDSADREIDWDRPPFADAYIFYAGNFLNYLQSGLPPAARSIAELTTAPLAQALSATDGLDAALIRLDDDGPAGGFVARAPVSSHALASELLALAAHAPAGGAPLAETLVEALDWLQGGPRQFGTDARSDPAAVNPAGGYVSPFDQPCRSVSLAYLSAGEPSGDELAATGADALPHFNGGAGGCGDDCLGTLANWAGAADLRDDLPGRQSAPVSWIAPGRPNGSISSAVSPADPIAFANLVATAFQRDAAVASGPQVSAAGLTPLDADVGPPGVVLGLSVPLARARWPGNLLRYALRAPSSPLEPPTVVDGNGKPAIDSASGLPLPGSRSLWSDVPDADLIAGGAGGRLPPDDLRQVFTDVASTRILDPANRLAAGNARIDRKAVGLAPGDPRTIEDALDWPAAQRTLGDPGLQAPVLVDDAESGRVVAFVATEDGMLHAIDAESGIELWAWMPKEMLPRIPELMDDIETTARSHGVDGTLVLHRYDPDGDGHIATASGEHLWLVFGLGRGGGRYYALDVAVPTDPRLAWSFELPDAAVLSLADPVITRLAIADSGQSPDQWIVLLAGGYDPRFDEREATGAGRGNAIYLVDAATGRLLWSAGGAGSALPLTGLASLASAPRALDLDGDGYLDRAYLLDVAGSLWRLDFANGMPADELATAHRLARLGAGTLRFFSTPDAALEQIGAVSRIAVVAGSGWLTRPREATMEDRLYVIWDRPGANVPSEMTDADLYDATGADAPSPADAPGWLYRLANHGSGEKVVGPAVTFDHVLRFQTYQPLPPGDDAPCGPPRSTARRYALDIRTALPRASAVESEEDKPDEFPDSGVPVGIRFGFPGPWNGSCEGCRPRAFGILGGDTFDPGYAGDPVRTSWRKLTPPPASP
jgi:type IV pilus assembly protein PilY1